MLPRLLAEGLNVSLNTDDPPMFNTTLNGEYLAAAHTFGLSLADLQHLALNAARASLLAADKKAMLIHELLTTSG